MALHQIPQLTTFTVVSNEFLGGGKEKSEYVVQAKGLQCLKKPSAPSVDPKGPMSRRSDGYFEWCDCDP